MSAYEFSRDRVFLEKAEDLGQRLLQAFSEGSPIPFASINLQNGRGSSPGWTGGALKFAYQGNFSTSGKGGRKTEDGCIPMNAALAWRLVAAYARETEDRSPDTGITLKCQKKSISERIYMVALAIVCKISELKNGIFYSINNR